MQRYTIPRRKTCVASTEKEKKANEVQPAIHHFGRKIVCRDEKKGSETSNRAATHYF